MNAQARVGNRVTEPLIEGRTRNFTGQAAPQPQPHCRRKTVSAVPAPAMLKPTSAQAAGRRG